MTSRILLGAIVLLALFHPRPGEGQEIGVFAGSAWSDQREVGNPVMVGLRAQYLPVSRFGLRIDYTRYRSTPRWSATTCDFYFPLNEGCRAETVENSIELRSYDLSLVAVPLLRSGWRVEVAVGITSNHLSHEVRGTETDRLLYSDEGYPSGSSDVLGFLGNGGDGLVQALTLTRTEIAGLPVMLGLSWRHRSVDPLACGTDGTCLYDESLDLHELGFQGSWRF